MMELGIDDESEISTTHDNTKDNPKPASEEQPPEQEDSGSKEGESEQSTDTKLAAIGLKKESSDRFYDTINHFGILLSEKFDNVSKEENNNFVVDINDRKFTIKFNDKFFMVSEDYNYEIGDDSDIQCVVNTFAKLSSLPHDQLVSEYNKEIV